MDRIHNVNLPIENTCSSINANRFSSFEGGGPSRRLFIPLHYEKNYAYPLLVWLHGPTGRESEINQVMPHVSLRNYIGMSPRGVVEDVVIGGQATFTWDQEVNSIDHAVEDVLQCIEIAKQQYNVADNRVFLAGYDAGGTMALRLALRMPNHFAGVASIGGSLPSTNQPLLGVQHARSTPILIAYGRDSDAYTTNNVCQDLRLLHAAGMSVMLRQYPCGQEVTTQMLSDLNAWVMELVSGPTADATHYDGPTRLRLEDHN